MSLDRCGEISNFDELTPSVQENLDEPPEIKPLPTGSFKKSEIQVVPVDIGNFSFHLEIARAPTLRSEPRTAEAEPSGLMKQS